MNAPRAIRNKTWSELTVGDSATVERACAVQDLLLFAHVSGNTNPLMLPPTDGERLASDIIAPSMWVGSLISAVLGNLLPGPGTLYRSQTLSFPRRVHIGDRLRAIVTCTEKREEPTAVFETRVMDAEGRAVCEGLAIVDTPRTSVEIQLSRWLQLNAVVLCGEESVAQTRHHRLLRATEARFYEEPDAGVRDVMDWYALNRNKNVWFRAAGVYNRILSEPQLFIEGNHRTGALIVSYLLLREGLPPFVLTEKNAKGFFDPSSLMRKTKKRKLVEQFKFGRITRAFADFLEKQKDATFLISARM